MRVAIVHEWFAAIAGSERVVEQIISIFPQADIFAVYADPTVTKAVSFLQGRHITTTFIQQLPFAKRKFRNYLPLMPLAIEQLDLTGYDLVISSSHAVAKGVIVGPDQLHISYIHSPIRYAWDLQHQYLRESGLDKGLKGWLAKIILHGLRAWDSRSANGVDHLVSNSRYISRRVLKCYRRESTVIYPPVNVASFSLRAEKKDFYLAASRLVPYKRMDLIVEAFKSLPSRNLIVIGDGPEMPKLRALASGCPNISLLGYQPFESLRDHMQSAKAFVFAAEEDFGITPVEAMACGTPVIAYARGGVLETVVVSDDAAQQTGLLFNEQNASSIQEAILRFEAMTCPPTPQACRTRALDFSEERFREEFSNFVLRRVDEFRNQR
jgi:glycosyltransferase involved in cell wall biosynthesis